MGTELRVGLTRVGTGRPQVPTRVRKALDRVITLYEAWGKPERAAAWRLRRPDPGFPTDPFAGTEPEVEP
jgi:hypothetical protein